MRPRTPVPGLLKYGAIVIAAAAIGAAVGLAFAAMAGDNEDGASPDITTSPPLTATHRRQATSTEPTRRSIAARVRVLSAVLYPAVTASGRARSRARLTVRVRVMNRGAGTLAGHDPLLLVGAGRISPDPRAPNAAGALLEPLAPARSATGELRFETAGAVTRLLTTQPRARLRIAGRTVALNIRINRTAAPSG